MKEEKKSEVFKDDEKDNIVTRHNNDICGRNERIRGLWRE